MMRAASFLRRYVPRRMLCRVRRLFRPPLYQGDFATWSDAQRASRGYADTAILEKTIAAARAVRDGGAAWDRDTVLFSHPVANEPLLRTLRAVAAAHGGKLHVVDFGGALGSTWWQHRPWLVDYDDIRWSIIEQPALVAAGRSEFTRGPLRFFNSLAECVEHETPRIALFSSVLPYLEQPHAILADIRRSPVRQVIVDRTGFTSRGRDRLTVQQVPPEIYDASYPCWFFDRASLLAPFAGEWRVVDAWLTDDEVDIDAEHGGFMLERIR